jgi:hypothetical protein
MTATLLTLAILTLRMRGRGLWNPAIYCRNSPPIQSVSNRMATLLAVLAFLTLRRQGACQLSPASRFLLRRNLSHLWNPSSLWPTGWRHCLRFLLFLNLRGQWDLTAERCYQTTAVVFTSPKPNHTLSLISDRQDDDIACGSCYSLTLRGQEDLTAERYYQTTAVVLTLSQPYT